MYLLPSTMLAPRSGGDGGAPASFRLCLAWRCSPSGAVNPHSCWHGVVWEAEVWQVVPTSTDAVRRRGAGGGCAPMLWVTAARVLKGRLKDGRGKKRYSRHLLGLEKVPRCEILMAHNPFSLSSRRLRRDLISMSKCHHGEGTGDRGLSNPVERQNKNCWLESEARQIQMRNKA